MLVPDQMGQIYYNIAKNNRFKTICLAMFFILTNLIVILGFYLIGKDDINEFNVTIIFVVAFFSCPYIIGLITFGQVIEKNADGQITTFYRLGKQKLKLKAVGKFVSVTMKQDMEKYFCLTVKTSEGLELIYERYPTMREANERLEEFRKVIG